MMNINTPKTVPRSTFDINSPLTSEILRYVLQLFTTNSMYADVRKNNIRGKAILLLSDEVDKRG